MVGPAVPPVAELPQTAAAPVNLYTEVADGEQLLEELDACGVSGAFPLAPACLTTTQPKTLSDA